MEENWSRVNLDNSNGPLIIEVCGKENLRTLAREGVNFPGSGPKGRPK